MAVTDTIERFIIEVGRAYKCKKSYTDKATGLHIEEGQFYQVETYDFEHYNCPMVGILQKFALSRLFFWEHFSEESYEV